MFFRFSNAKHHGIICNLQVSNIHYAFFDTSTKNIQCVFTESSKSGNVDFYRISAQLEQGVSHGSITNLLKFATLYPLVKSFSHSNFFINTVENCDTTSFFFFFEYSKNILLYLVTRTFY